MFACACSCVLVSARNVDAWLKRSHDGAELDRIAIVRSCEWWFVRVVAVEVVVGGGGDCGGGFMRSQIYRRSRAPLLVPSILCWSGGGNTLASAIFPYILKENDSLFELFSTNLCLCFFSRFFKQKMNIS